MTDEVKEALVKYAELKKEEALISEKLEELKPLIVSAMEASEVEQVETDQGKFTLTPRRTWMYTEETQAKEDEVKALKKKEEQTGVATYTTAYSLRFTANHDE